MPFHPRNKHQGHYNLSALANANPALKPLIIPGKGGDRTLDFSNPQAVRELNRALLAADYGVRDWDIPPGYLCPPIPGRPATGSPRTSRWRASSTPPCWTSWRRSGSRGSFARRARRFGSDTQRMLTICVGRDMLADQATEDGP